MAVEASDNARLDVKSRGVRRDFAVHDAEHGLLAAIVQSSRDAIISKDKNGIVMSWNSAAEALYGYTAAEAIGRHIGFIFPPELRGTELQDIMAHLRNSEGTQRVETVRLTKTGERIEVEVRISPIKDAAGELLGASAIAHNIGRRKRNERELVRWR